MSGDKAEEKANKRSIYVNKDDTVTHGKGSSHAC